MSRLWHFFQYNNAVPIAVSILFLGSGTVLAASPEARDIAGRAVYDAQTEVISVDNTYIANKDFANYTPQARIVGVTEDEEYYYIAYQFITIDVVDHVWSDITKDDTMKVSKASLGQYRDLGVYVTEQLNQRIARELAYLKEVQSFEKKHVTQKTVATKYGGLIGAMLDDKTEKLPGYTPVVKTAVAELPVPTVEAPRSPSTTPSVAAAATTASNSSTGSAPVSQPVPSGVPTLQVLGENPARVPLRNIYVDLGAVVSDDKNPGLAVRTYVNGEEVTKVEIETATPAEWVVRYEATDYDGNSGAAERRVIVYDPAIGSGTTEEKPPVEAPSQTTEPEPSVPTTPQQSGTSTPAETETAPQSQPSATSTATTSPALQSEEVAEKVEPTAPEEETTEETEPPVTEEEPDPVPEPEPVATTTAEQ